MKPPRTLLLLLAASLIFGTALVQYVAAKPPPRPPEVVTDKKDYEPGSTANILGAYFLPREKVQLQVLHADGTPDTGADHQPWQVDANSRGEFLTTWHVCEDDCLGSELQLTALGLQSLLTAQTRFTDGASGGSAGGLLGWLNVPQQWGGTLQNNNSRYYEGSTIPVRYAATLKSGSQHTILLSYDFSSGGTARFFDSLGSYDESDKTVNLLAGITGVGSAVPMAVAIPSDHSTGAGALPVGAQLPGLITTYNISALSFGAYSLVNGVKTLPVNFTVAAGGSSKTVLLAYGAHLAAGKQWGMGNGASVFPGASRKAYASLDGGPAVNVSVNPSTILKDTSSPTITACAPPVSLPVGANCQVAVPDFTHAVAATDDQTPSANMVITQAPAAGSTVGPGTVPVLLTVTDAEGNAASCTTSLTVVDATPPVISGCPPNVTVFAGNNLSGCTQAASWTPPTASDNCTVASLASNRNPGDTFPLGTTTVTYTAMDTAGNIASCSFTVTVVDTAPPIITCPPNLTDVPTDPGQCYAARANVSLGTPILGDNCGLASLVHDAPDRFSKGTTTVTWTVTDTSGNRATCQQLVTVNDHEPPTLSAPANITTDNDASGCEAVVSYVAPVGVDNCPGAATVQTAGLPSGVPYPVGTTTNTFTVTDSSGLSSACSFTITVFPKNQAWPNAAELTLTPNSEGTLHATISQCLTAPDQSRWFKLRIQPGSQVIATLTHLPENYDLVLFKDIGSAYRQITSLDDLVHITAEFANDAFSPSAFSPDAFSPSAFSPSAFSPSAFSPSAFSPSAFSPSAFSPSAFSPSAFSPDAFSPSAFSPSAFSPSAFSPSAFSPSAFSPSAFSPSAFSPSAFSPSAFSAAQLQSVIGVSAFEGTASEGIVVNTWDNGGDFYLRVRGRNGVSSPGRPFQLDVYLLPGACGSVQATPPSDAGSATLTQLTSYAAPGTHRTVILTDSSRMVFTPELTARLNALADKTSGVVVDVGQDPGVAFFNAQADANYGCPYAKNLVAVAIKGIIDRFRAGNPIEYVVIVGGDNVIPFFRHPDEAMLGPERNFVPPVKDLTASQASLRLGYILSQDRYGASCSLSLKTSDLPLPDLAVGRLVETPTEVVGMIDAFLSTGGGTGNGVAPTPTASLVTGYDFLADAAQAVLTELALGAANPEALISPNNQAPELGWTADDLRALLFSKRHDLIYLAGHFSDAGTLAADYRTHFLASELVSSTVDFKNSLIFSAGCHSGYNTVDEHAIDYVTLAPDWAQACARKQATLIAGTGYQYGDTDFVEYSERLYLEFTRQLRSGAGPVPVGKALANAKRIYLAATPQMRSIHQKAYLEATLFGLPMFSIDLPGTRLPAQTDPSIVGALQPAVPPSDPRSLLGLQYADVVVPASLTPTDVTVTNVEAGGVLVATYLSGSSGVVNNPAEPILPLEARNVSAPLTVLRGVGFRSGTYTDALDKIPLTGAATTEIRGVHATFLSDVFYPMRPWSVNYFGAVCTGSARETRLMVVPAQFKSDSPTAATGTIRQFSEMAFRLYYSANTDTITDASGTSVPALAAPPAISAVRGITSIAGDSVALSAVAVGNPAAGIPEVWVTYTALSGPYAGRWQSLNLAQDPVNSMLWTGALPVPAGTSSKDLRYMIQAVNGVGAVTLDTKLGAFHVPDEFDSLSTALLAPTRVDLLTPPVSGAYSTIASFSAKLTLADGATPLAGQRLVFSLGNQEIWATTDADGLATASLPLRVAPAGYALKASFPGAVNFAPSFTTSPFTVNRQTTKLAITPTVVYVRPNVDTRIVASLKDELSSPLNERSVLFVVTGPNGAMGRAVIADHNGLSPLGPVPLAAGNYAVTAYFNGTIPLPGNTITVDDGRYVPSSTVGTIVLLVVDDTPPQITCPADINQGTDPGQCHATINPGVATATDVSGSPITIVGVRNDGRTLTDPYPKGATRITWTATDSAGNPVSCTQTITVNDIEHPVITAPAPVSASTDVGQCTVSGLALGTPTTGDNCGVASVGNNAPTLFPKGTTTVIWTVTDTSGNTATAAQSVTVQDLVKPTINGCPGNLTVLTGPGRTTCDAVAAWPTPLVSDNCPGVTLTSDHHSGEAFPVGTTSVIYTATDAAGNQTTCSFTVTVLDTTPPGITAPPDLNDIPTDPGRDYATTANVNLGTPVTTDNCSVTGVNKNAPVLLPKGTNFVTWTVTDASGNMATCRQRVIVRDHEAPRITSLTASPAVLGNNHKMVTVTIIPSVSDNATPPITSRVLSVTCNEPPDTTGDGNTQVDWLIPDPQTDPLTVQLRAERAQNGTGRIYTITIRCSDGAGNLSTAQVTVSVPK